MILRKPILQHYLRRTRPDASGRVRKARIVPVGESVEHAHEGDLIRETQLICGGPRRQAISRRSASRKLASRVRRGGRHRGRRPAQFGQEETPMSTSGSARSASTAMCAPSSVQSATRCALGRKTTVCRGAASVAISFLEALPQQRIELPRPIEDHADLAWVTGHLRVCRETEQRGRQEQDACDSVCFTCGHQSRFPPAVPGAADCFGLRAAGNYAAPTAPDEVAPRRCRPKPWADQLAAVGDLAHRRPRPRPLLPAAARPRPVQVEFRTATHPSPSARPPAAGTAAAASGSRPAGRRSPAGAS